MKTRILIPFVFFLFLAHSIMAGHMIGGEITWQCQSGGQYVFTMKLYRDCNGVPLSGPFNLTSNSPISSIPMLQVGINEITPVCNPSPLQPHLSCATATGSDTGVVEEYIFRSNPVTLMGVPPVGGWNFYYETCCRSSGITNTTCSGIRLQSRMYAYGGRTAFPCFDSSPEFFEKPIPVYCSDNYFANAGTPHTMNNNAADSDLDSLSYEWSPSLGTGGSPCGYVSGYAFDNPLPDSLVNIYNRGATINPLNGEVSFSAFTPGNFVVCVKTKSWKNGVLVAEVSRDIQVYIKNGRSLQWLLANLPPHVVAPFVYNGLPSFVDTIVAGDTVRFALITTEGDLDSLGNFQSYHLEATGPQFSDDFTNPTNCLRPECATLSPNPLTTTGNGALIYNFNWVTSCNHLSGDSSYAQAGTVHNFVFRLIDDFCPIPGTNLFTISIVVLPPPGWPLHPFVNQSNDTLFSSVTAASYQWYRNDTALAGAVSSSYVPVIAGNYSVEAILPGGCSAKSPAYAFIPASIYFPESELTIDISPNPFQHTVSISATAKKPVPFQVHLMDALGQTILSWNYSKSQANEVVDLSFLPAGIYLIQFCSESSQKTFRLVKMD